MSLFELVWLLSYCNQYDSARQDVCIFNLLCMDQSRFISVGIDVSKATLAVACMVDDRSVVTCAVPNTAIGVRSIRKKLMGFAGRILLESTGRYHLLATVLLTEASFQVVVINPLLSAHYSSTSVRKLKTDKADAIKLAELALLRPDLPVFALTRNEVCTRQKIGLLASLEKQLQRFKSTLKSFQELEQQLTEKNCSEEVSTLMKTVHMIQKSMHRLEGEIVDAISCSPDQKKRCSLLESIPGISQCGASLLVHYFAHWEHQGKEAKRAVAYVGLDVSVRESGAWKGKGKLSKRGNRYVRKRLFSSAWGAVMIYPEFKAWYTRLKEQGRKHREALIIIARKLLTIAFAVLKSNRPYSSTIAFPS